jgi:hypothetical protein
MENHYYSDRRISLLNSVSNPCDARQDVGHMACIHGSMEKQIITVLLDDRPYHLTLEVEQTGNERIYRVSDDQEREKLSDLIPDPLEFSVNGSVKLLDRIRTVEGQELAREIWKAIKDQFEDPRENADS